MATQTNDLLFDIKDGVATLTMNRPEARNALSLDMRKAMRERLLECERDSQVRVVLVKGAGEHFMAGGDVKRFAGDLDTDDRLRYEGFLNGIHDLHPMIFAMRRMPKPIIASVRGAAAGFGLSLVMACDMAVAADDAFFTLAYVHIGTTPDGGGTYFLPRIVGLKQAMEIAWLGDRFNAERAKELGIVNFVVPVASLEAETAKLAKRLANGPTAVYGRAKNLLMNSAERTMETQLQAEAEMFAASAIGNDFKEGVRAFVEKRPPKFTGS
jgi:2-(1,2-epoxy-1,2-dihydrophenyl)acetyl-CoA isomerase